jgi:hypothetical protein
MGLRKNAPLSRAYPGPDDARGIPADDRSRWHVARDDSAGAYNAFVTDANSRHHDRVRPDEAVAADVGVGMERARHVVREDNCVERDVGAFADVNAAWIRHVEVGAKRDFCAAADIHSRDFSQAPQVQLDCPVAQAQAHAAKQRNRPGTKASLDHMSPFVRKIFNRRENLVDTRGGEKSIRDWNSGRNAVSCLYWFDD